MTERLTPGRPGARDRVLEAAIGLIEHARPDATDVSFPGPLSRRIVHWLDQDALHPSRIHRYLSISATVARRPDYFPAGVPVDAVIPPSGLPGLDGSPPGEGFFAVSRLDPPKRLDLVIAAVRSMPDPTVRLRLTGVGPSAAACRTSRGDDRIQFLGEISDHDLAAEYRGCRAVVFVPSNEDLGLVTYEAQISARPVITTSDSGGPLEMVTDGVNGLIVTPEPAALAAAMAQLHGDEQLARRLGDAGRSSALTITWESVVDAVLAERQPSRPSPRRRRRVVALSTYPASPAAMGGQIRIERLLRALGEHADVDLLCLGEERSTLTFGGVRQHTFPPGRSLVDQDWASSAIAWAFPPVTSAPRSSATECGRWPTPRVWPSRSGRGRAVSSLPRTVVADDGATRGVRRAQRRVRPEDVHVRAERGGASAGNTVRAVESSVLQMAQLVTAVSPDDAAALRTQAPSMARFEVVPNGFDPVPDSSRDPRLREQRRRQYLAVMGRAGVDPACDHLAVFVGSAHPPNIEATARIVTAARRLPNVLFMLVGAHGDHLDDVEVPANVVIRGRVTDRDLQGLLSCCDVALNPVTGGSGTNLKMLEYVAAGAPVIATADGARGLGLSPGLHYAAAEPHRLDDALRTDLASPQWATARAIRAYAAIREWSWPALSRRWADLMMETIE